MEEQFCKKRIINIPQGTSIVEIRMCNRSIYRDGLCKRHYKKKQAKLKNWGDREHYRDATEDELNRGCSLKLKNSNIHHVYRYRKGIMQRYQSRTNLWISTDILPDFNLFCITC